MKKTPLLQMKDGFGSKEKLIEELLGLLVRTNNLSKDELKKKLQSQSNQKLLKLMQREKTIQERFGSRDKLIETIAASKAANPKKADKDFQKRLAGYGAGKLLNIAQNLQIKK